MGLCRVLVASNETEEIISQIGNLNINDSNVIGLRRSARICEQQQRKESLNLPLDLVNNNLTVSGTPTDQPSVYGADEFELERENIHCQLARKHFKYITRNIYVGHDKKVAEVDSAEDCGCELTPVQLKNGANGCGPDCLNRKMFIECDKHCKRGPLCGNQPIQRFQNARCTVFITEKKGFGLFASTMIPAEKFIMEYVGGKWISDLIERSYCNAKFQFYAYRSGFHERVQKAKL